MRLDASDAGDHGVGGHGRSAYSVAARHGYPAPMTMTDRPLRRPEHDRAAARRPRQAARARRSAGRSTTRPTASSTRSTSTAAQREHDAFVDVARERSAPTVHVLDDETRRPGPRLHLRSAARHRSRRDPAPAGQAEPAGEPAVLEAWTDGRRHPDRSAGSRRPGTDRGRRHVLAPARPVLHRADAADERRAASTSWRDLVGGDVRIFDVPYWQGPAELVHLHVASSRRSPTTSRSSTCRCCRSGCGSCSASWASGWSRCRTRSSRRSAATCSPSGPAS